MQLMIIVQGAPEAMSSQAISHNYSIVLPETRGNKRIGDEVKEMLISLEHGIERCVGADIE